ncbi:hypothetical protein FHG87_008305 [Trinorchestia longiramus]|nr:hypothetical protein FHG87_008305 [Trinorchestia longiramus]
MYTSDLAGSASSSFSFFLFSHLLPLSYFHFSIYLLLLYSTPLCSKAFQSPSVTQCTHNYTYTSHSHKKLDKYHTELSQARKQKCSAPSNTQIHMTPHTAAPNINTSLGYQNKTNVN